MSNLLSKVISISFFLLFHLIFEQCKPIIRSLSESFTLGNNNWSLPFNHGQDPLIFLLASTVLINHESTTIFCLVHPCPVLHLSFNLQLSELVLIDLRANNKVCRRNTAIRVATGTRTIFKLGWLRLLSVKHSLISLKAYRLYCRHVTWCGACSFYFLNFRVNYILIFFNISLVCILNLLVVLLSVYYFIKVNFLIWGCWSRYSNCATLLNLLRSPFKLLFTRNNIKGIIEPRIFNNFRDYMCLLFSRITCLQRESNVFVVTFRWFNIHVTFIIFAAVLYR